MPENINGILWWALNGAILIVAAYIKADLKDIKHNLQSAHDRYDNHETRIVRLEVSCKLRHGSDEHFHSRISDIGGN